MPYVIHASLPITIGRGYILYIIISHRLHPPLLFVVYSVILFSPHFRYAGINVCSEKDILPAGHRSISKILGIYLLRNYKTVYKHIFSVEESRGQPQRFTLYCTFPERTKMCTPCTYEVHMCHMLYMHHFPLP